MKCTNCGHEIKKSAQFCNHCGRPVAVQKGRSLKISVQHIIILVLAVIVLILAAVIFVLRGDNGKEGAGEDTLPETAAQTKEFAEAEEVLDTDFEDAVRKQAGTDPQAQQSADETDGARTQTVQTADAEQSTEPAEEIYANQISMEHVRSVTATSSLSEYGMTHSPDRIRDGDTATAWVEGAEGAGIGESVAFSFDDTYQVSGFLINAGYQKSEDLYMKNARPESVRVTCPDGRSKVYVLDDIFGMQNVEFEEPIITGEITLVIESIYPGSKYEDTAISELALY